MQEGKTSATNDEPVSVFSVFLYSINVGQVRVGSALGKQGSPLSWGIFYWVLDLSSGCVTVSLIQASMNESEEHVCT